MLNKCFRMKDYLRSLRVTLLPGSLPRELLLQTGEVPCCAGGSSPGHTCRSPANPLLSNSGSPFCQTLCCRQWPVLPGACAATRIDCACPRWRGTHHTLDACGSIPEKLCSPNRERPRHLQGPPLCKSQISQSAWE